MTALQHRRLKAMKYLVKIMPYDYRLQIIDTRINLMERIHSSYFDWYRPIATVDKDIHYFLD